VFMTPTEVYAATFGDKRYAYGPEEFVCDGDECVEVTIGLYLPASASSATISDGLLDGLGLLPRAPNPEPIIDWEACERGQQPHPAYSCDQFEEWQRDQQR
jgi:hypothetical protein